MICDILYPISFDRSFFTLSNLNKYAYTDYININLLMNSIFGHITKSNLRWCGFVISELQISMTLYGSKKGRKGKEGKIDLICW